MNMKVFLFSLLFLLHLIQQCESTSRGWMEPIGMIELKDGDTLKLKCTVNENNYTNEKLNFVLGSTLVDDRFVRKIGNNAIELVMPNLANISSTIICRHSESGIAYTDVKVGTSPTNVTYFKCISNNWNNLTCTFHKPYNPVAVHYSVTYYTNLNKNSIYQCTDDKLKTDDRIFTCFVKHGAYRRASEHFTFTVTANNSLGNNTQIFNINNYAIVVPSQVEDVSADNITSRSANVSWRTPVDIRSFPRKLDLEFSVSSKYTSHNESQKFIGIEPSTSNKSLELPYAHTWYGIKIRIKSHEAENSEELWSQWSSKKLIKTEARRPDNPPVMATGGFNFGPGGDIIYVYWQNLPEQFHNGEDFGYNVYSDDDKVKNPNKITDLYATFSNKFSNDNSKPVIITVYSRNEKGSSEMSSSMMIPSEKKRLPPPRKLVKTLNNEIYNLTWLPPKVEEGVITNYTVFWCSVKSELPNNCDSSINFVYRKPDETFFVYKSNLTINFAIAANSKQSSSGMIWSSCTAANSHEIGKIKTIWIPRLTSTTIEIEWKLECTDSGTVVGYQIEYCPIREPKTLDCKEPIKKVNTTIQKHTLDNLQPYTTYRINLRMFSASTMGPLSESQANTTLEAAPSPVRNLMVREVSNVSAELYWDPPEFSNGVLLYYQIWANSRIYSVHDKVEIGNTNNRMNLTLTKLKAYTEYQISVLACTKDCSIPVSTNMTTTVGNPGIIEQPMITPFNDDKLSNYSNAEIKWDEPKFKGGEINYYELKIIEEVAGNKKETYYKMARKYCIYHELCSNSVKMYGFSVRAVNFLSTPHSKKIHHETTTFRHHSRGDDCNRNDEELMEALKKIEEADPHGSFLKGNWSVPISHSCNSKDLNAAQIAMLAGSILVVLVMLITFRYFYKEYKRMKDIFPQMPPGLENLTGEKKKKEKMDQEKIPDILRNVDNTSINCEDESGKLLKTSRNNSINENDCSSSIRSESTQSEVEQNYNDNDSYAAFENNDRDQADSLKQFIINPTTGEEITLSPTMKMTSTPQPPKTSLIMNPKMPLSASSSGYVKHPPVKQNPSYVAYSIYNPLQSNTHTTLGAYDKPPILLHNNSVVHDKNNLKTPVVATTDQEGISGYVTHRQLSDFGHRMQ